MPPLPIPNSSVTCTARTVTVLVVIFKCCGNRFIVNKAFGPMVQLLCPRLNQATEIWNKYRIKYKSRKSPKFAITYFCPSSLEGWSPQRCSVIARSYHIAFCAIIGQSEGKIWVERAGSWQKFADDDLDSGRAAVHHKSQRLSYSLGKHVELAGSREILRGMRYSSKRAPSLWEEGSRNLPSRSPN